MSLVPFDTLPDRSRLWIFAADRPLSLAEADLLVGSAERGLRDWSAHGSPVTWGHHLVFEQFLFLGMDETRTALTGCSIDGAIRQIHALESRLGLALLDHGRIFFRDAGAVRVVDRSEFRRLAEAGHVHGETIVFNNVLATVGEFRQGLWEVPLRRSWHAEAFPVQA